MGVMMKIRYLWKITPTFLLSIGLFFDIVVLEYFSSSLYTLLQYIVLLPIILYCVCNIKNVIDSQWIVFFTVTVIAFFMVFSSYLNNVETYYLRAAIYEGVLYLTIFVYIAVLSFKDEIETFLIAGKWYLLLVVFTNDILMVVFPDKFYNINGREIGTCLIGNKFSVAYVHLMLLFVLIILEKNIIVRNKKMILYTIIMSVLCIYIDCMTAMLGSWLFLVLYFLVPFVKKILSNYMVFFACFFCGAFLLILFENILSVELVQQFIVQVLHRDATLTGRMEVYPYIFQVIPSHKWLGYGYGTTIIKTVSTWYANAQNAFWDFVIRYGFITMVCLVILLFIVVKRYNKIQIGEPYNSLLWINFSMLYVYIFIGIGEIVYNEQFFFYIALLSGHLFYIWIKGRSIGEKTYDK